MVKIHPAKAGWIFLCIHKYNMQPRWNPEEEFKEELEEFDDYKPSFLKIIARLFAGFIIWSLTAFAAGAILASFCAGIYFVMDVYIKYVQLGN